MRWASSSGGCATCSTRATLDCSSVSKGLQALTQALLQQLRADHEVAAALCRKVGLRSCKELRDAKKVDWCDTRLTDADLTTLGTLGSVLPALKQLWLCECAGVLDGMQRLAEGLGARAAGRDLPRS